MQYTGAQENDLTIRANMDRAVDEGIATHHVLPAATDEHAHVDRLKPVILDRPPALHIIQVDRIKGGALRHLFGLVEPARAIRAPKNVTGGFRLFAREEGNILYSESLLRIVLGKNSCWAPPEPQGQGRTEVACV